jgi:hypothetical protein
MLAGCNDHIDVRRDAILVAVATTLMYLESGPEGAWSEAALVACRDEEYTWLLGHRGAMARWLRWVLPLPRRGLRLLARMAGA